MRLEKRSEGGGAEDLPQEPAKTNRQQPVFIYILILFAVAFALILISFLMHQRSNQQVLGELHNNVNALEELQDALDENLRLEKELEESQEQVEELEKALEQAQGADLERQALLALYQLQQAYAAGDQAACRDTLAALEDGLAEALPKESPGHGAASPALRYRQLQDAVAALPPEEGAE